MGIFQKNINKVSNQKKVYSDAISLTASFHNRRNGERNREQGRPYLTIPSTATHPSLYSLIKAGGSIPTA